MNAFLRLSFLTAMLFISVITVKAQGDPVFPSIAVNPANPTFNANDVTYLNSDTAVAVGNNGMVWRSIDGGLNWSVISTFTATAHNNAVIMRNNYICIAGNAGTVTFSNNKGLTWQNTAQAQAGVNYHGVHFADTTFGASVGDNGDAVIYHWVGGLGWAHIAAPVAVRLNAVATFKTSQFASVDGSAIAVGDNGTVVTYSFGSWTALTPTTTLNIYGVYLFSDNVTVLAVGDSGLIMRSPDFGNTWSILHSGTNEALRDVSEGVVANQFLAVGDSGVIYESTDGGFTFTRFTYGSNTSNLKGVSAKTPRGAFGGSGSVLRTFTQDSTLIDWVSDSVLCRGEMFKASIKLFGLYGTSNMTSLELSDSSGSFTTPTVIGTKMNPLPSDSITGIIPANAKASTQYKLRLKTADPMILSNAYVSNFTVLPSPLSKNVLVQFNQLFVNSQSGCTYQWYYNSSPMAGATDTIVTTTGNGNYYVVITGSNGCTFTTNTFNYNATSVKSTNTSRLRLAPNPTQGLLNIFAPDAFAGKTMSIYNTLGKKVDSLRLCAGANLYHAEVLDAGIYFVETDGIVMKFIVEK